MHIETHRRKSETINMIEACEKRLHHHDLIKVSNDILFIFTTNQTLVATPLQLFLISHSHKNYIARLRRLKGVVESGEIKNISDLVTYNGFKPGNNNSMFDGLELIRMDLSWVK